MRTRARVVDEFLVLAAQAGQADAFEELARRWHQRLLRHAGRLSGDPEAAREIAQDAWLATARFRVAKPLRRTSRRVTIVERVDVEPMVENS